MSEIYSCRRETGLLKRLIFERLTKLRIEVQYLPVLSKLEGLLTQSAQNKSERDLIQNESQIKSRFFQVNKFKQLQKFCHF